MTTRDIRAPLREMYDVDVCPDLISRVTDAVVDELAEWQSRHTTACGLLHGPGQAAESEWRGDGWLG